MKIELFANSLKNRQKISINEKNMMFIYRKTLV